MYQEKTKKSNKRISRTFQKKLFICIVTAFLVVTAFSWFLQTRLSESNAVSLMSINIEDVKQDISDASDENLLEITRSVTADINKIGSVTSEQLVTLSKEYDVAEINIIDERGIITESTNKDFIGFDMSGGSQSGEFLVLLTDEKKELVQEYQAISYDAEIFRKYAGVALENGGFVQVAYDAVYFQQDINSQVIGATRNRHIGENGCIIIADESWTIVSDRNNNEDKNLAVTGIWIDEEVNKPNQRFTADVYGESSYCMYVVSEGYYIIAVLPVNEIVLSRNVSVCVTVLMQLIIFVLLFLLVNSLINRHVVKNVRRVNNSLERITAGDLDVVVDVRENREFSSLSDGINSTVVTLKQYIDEAAARIDRELEFAKAIQCSTLPNIFPPYPNRHEFDIFADMITAKEVGGDFYDFYLLGENRLAFLVADVSGKGIPAAMFMMTSKTLIKGLAEAGHSVEKIFTLANEKLCENNEAGMFVTAWMGIIDLETGMLEYANAGHNPALIKQGGNNFAYMKTPANFILAGMEGMVYSKNTVRLEKGDKIYLYTDGVTEATNAKEEFYGNDRLKNLLVEIRNRDVKSLCEAVREDIEKFADNAPRFDDITMLCLEYKSRSGKDG